MECEERTQELRQTNRRVAQFTYVCTDQAAHTLRRSGSAYVDRTTRRGRTMEVSSPRVLDEWTFVDDEAEVMPSAPPAQSENSSELQVTSTASTGDGDVPAGYLKVRLRIGEQTRMAHFKATQGVQDFTEKFFSEEIANRKRIRLIYMGMLLIPERSMGKFGIEEDGVIHAVINDAPPVAHPEASQQVELKGLTNPANTLLLTTGLILYGLWTLMYHHPHLFSWKATFLLALLSGVHVSAMVARFSH